MVESKRELPLIWSPNSESDLLSIWRWGVAHFSTEMADKHLRDILRATVYLVDFPETGVARDQLVAGARSIVIYPTVVFYRITDSSIEIIRVVDGRRNLAAFFPASSDS